MQAASAATFAGWADKIAAALVGAGAEPVAAKSIASMSVSAVEGAIAQSRGARSVEPLDDVRIALSRVIGSVIPAAAPPRVVS
ncbi:hypothetical protein ACFVUS_33490 [Nocardia sp. NPDC058058]|uniref:LmrA/YxaF family transcription factor n=1 Tax=Nocardia sp. NPDC058058 TaxID=3346317 RepID=UPI0036DE80F3